MRTGEGRAWAGHHAHRDQIRGPNFGVHATANVAPNGEGETLISKPSLIHVIVLHLKSSWEHTRAR